jgi:hypothetical protein
MEKMDIGFLKKDISFIEKGIGITNQVKKKVATSKQEDLEATRMQKKMRTFLRKNRKIHMLFMPNFFSKHSKNTTKLETEMAVNGD